MSLEHARFAARLGGRVGIVRETYGIAAYRCGDYRTATRELRTAQRITGDLSTLPMLADAERGLGRPEKALDIAASDEAGQLDAELTLEMMIVVAGAYADTGDIETALRTVEIPALRHRIQGRWPVRLWMAYADLLEKAGRTDEARKWITLAADADTEHLTDAAERLGRPAPAASPSMWDSLETLSVVDAFSDEEEEQDEEDETVEPPSDGDGDADADADGEEPAEEPDLDGDEGFDTHPGDEDSDPDGAADSDLDGGEDVDDRTGDTDTDAEDRA